MMTLNFASQNNLAANDYQMLFFCENVGRIFFKHQTSKIKINLKKRGVLTTNPCTSKTNIFKVSTTNVCTLRIPKDKPIDLSKNDHV